MNVDEHDGPRTAAVLLGSAVIGLAAVGATFWIFTGVVGAPAAAGSAQAVMGTPGATGTTIPAVPTTSATTWVIPSPTASSFTRLPVSVAPPELPTMTTPVAGETGDPGLAGPVAPTPSVTPTAVQPPPTTAASPGISDVSMSCQQKGDRVVGELSFRTTTTVPVVLIAGGQAAHQAFAGPGSISIKTSGKRGSFCLATVGRERFGPMPAS